jgi:hypothetical protein
MTAVRAATLFLFVNVLLLSIAETIVLPSIWFFLKGHVRDFCAFRLSYLRAWR